MLKDATQAPAAGRMSASALPQLTLAVLPPRLEKVIKRSDLGAAHVRALRGEIKK